MRPLTETLLRTTAGVLAAGVIAPLTLLLPEQFQSPWGLVALTLVCVATFVSWRRARSS